MADDSFGSGAWYTGAMIGLSSFANWESARQAQQAGELNAQQAEYEAMLAERNAKIEERNFRSQVYRLTGANRVAVAKSGITMDGSAQAAEDDNVRQAEMDALMIKNNGILRAQSLRQQAAVSRYQGHSQATSMHLRGLGQGLTSLAQYNNAKDAKKERGMDWSNKIFYPPYKD